MKVGEQRGVLVGQGPALLEEGLGHHGEELGRIGCAVRIQEWAPGGAIRLECGVAQLGRLDRKSVV